jgi:hypothetical protein
MSIWKSWSDLSDILKSKDKVYLFGRSEDWTSKVLKKIKNNIKISILDNNKTYHGQSYMGIDIYDPKIIKSKNFKKSYIIICAEPDSIVEELESKGFTADKDFCASPDLIDWGYLQNLKKNNSLLLVSSSDYFDLSRSRGSKNGGGLFLCDFDTNKYEKKADGQFRQIIEVNDNLFVVEYVEKKIYVFDKKFKLLEKFDLDQSVNKNEKPNYCGITFHEKSKTFYVANSANDIISGYDQTTFKKSNEIVFSEKNKLIEDGQSHINDLTVLDDLLLVSYFSKSGLWRKGIFDGGVSEINLDNNEKTELIKNLKQPHSPEVFNNKICVLDSMGRKLLIGDTIKCTFPGFVRGLAFDGQYYYVGQSEDMYTSQNFGKDNYTTMCNAGIYKVDVDKNISRFISLYENMNIHDILILN